ncbi:MAG TPA: hypothetical protein VF615_01555 [Longimicrobiaceae bacterium]|jgi:hypothetical protein
MSARTYYARSLLLPLLAAAGAGVAGMLLGESAPAAPWLGIAMYSGLVGGLPYMLVAGGILWWSRRRPARELRRAIWLAPLLMVPVQLLPVLVYSVAARGGADAGRFAESMLFMGAFVLLFGYGYVALVEAGAAVGRRAGLVAPPAP